MILSLLAALYLSLVGDALRDEPPSFRFPCGTGIGHPCFQLPADAQGEG